MFETPEWKAMREKCEAIQKEIEDAVKAIGGDLDYETNGGIGYCLRVEAFRVGHYQEFGSKGFYVTVGSYGASKSFRKQPLPIAEIAAYLKQYIEKQQEAKKRENAIEELRKENQIKVKELQAKYGLTSYGDLDSDSRGLNIKLLHLTPETADRILELLKINNIPIS